MFAHPPSIFHPEFDELPVPGEQPPSVEEVPPLEIAQTALLDLPPLGHDVRGPGLEPQPQVTETGQQVAQRSGIPRTEVKVFPPIRGLGVFPVQAVEFLKGLVGPGVQGEEVLVRGVEFFLRHFPKNGVYVCGGFARTGVRLGG